MQTYLRLLGYLKVYWKIFLLSIFGLWLFSAVQIAFIDLMGYMINVLTVVTGEGEVPDGVSMINIDAGLTARIAEYLFPGGDVLAQSRIALPVTMLILALANLANLLIKLMTFQIPIIHAN